MEGSLGAADGVPRGFVLTSSYHANWCRTSDSRARILIHLGRKEPCHQPADCRGWESIDIDTRRVLLMKN